MNAKEKEQKRIYIKVAAIPGESYIPRALFALIIACLLVYVYLVGVSIMNLIAQKEAMAMSDRLQSSVSSLEAEYFELSKNMSAAQGVERGFTNAKKVSYIRRDGVMGAAVTRNDI